MPPPEQNSVPVFSDKALHILAAAERCFVINGFHRATMQEVAREAQMSPGNLYRYFPSKAELVYGLVLRDRAMLLSRIEAIRSFGDLKAGFLQMCRSFFIEEPIERVILWIEKWAEATRDPFIAELTKNCYKEIFDNVHLIFEEARAEGKLPAHFDIEAFSHLMLFLSDGLFAQRCLNPQFDAERALRMIEVLFEAALNGQLILPSRQEAQVSKHVDAIPEEKIS